MEYEKKGQNYYHCAFSRRLIRSKLEIFISNSDRAKTGKTSKNMI